MIHVDSMKRAVIKEIIVHEKPMNPIVMKKLNRFTVFTQRISTSKQPMPEIEKHDEDQNGKRFETGHEQYVRTIYGRKSAMGVGLFKN